ncbi:acetate--CoA ligase [soil metagenome]
MCSFRSKKPATAMLPTIKTLEQYHTVYQQSIQNPEGFWADVARHFQWRKQWDTVLQWDFVKPDVKWFNGGELNITENCLDRYLVTQPDKKAIIWESNDPAEASITYTYKELHAKVGQLANVLKNLDVKKGDRVCIYMPMIPELTMALLACARIGAVHSVVFAGFSARSLADRINDADAQVVLTADGSYRGAKAIDLKAIVDEALTDCKGVRNVLIYQRTSSPITMQPGRDLWWHDEIAKVNSQCEAVAVSSEDPLFILYTSGSTGKPKGILHTMAGYMVYTAYTFANVFQYQPDDIFWCTADIGWVTGHSYIVYGPLLNGATVLMFEGIPTWPNHGRFWEVIDKHQVSIFYTAPTAIRSLMAGEHSPKATHKLDNLRILGTVGEPINVEAWEWYHEHVGKGNCPIVDTWWQTETGGIMISPLAGITPTKPGFATLPLPGILPALLDEKGQEIQGNGEEGRLCIKFPWPGMARTIWGDHNRFRETYFSAFPNYYFTGDGCRRDLDGYYRITGRMDDIIIVSGHNLGTAEIESAIDEHELVNETAVVGYPHAVKGYGVYAYVVLFAAAKGRDEEVLRKEINKLVSRIIGPIAKPDKIQFVPGLPKTRSGKIMRRILRKIAEGETENLGDISTLLDPGVVEEIKNGKV